MWNPTVPNWRGFLYDFVQLSRMGLTKRKHQTIKFEARPQAGFSNSTSDHTFLYNATKANNIHQCQLINAELITYREHRLEDYFSCMLHINRQAFTRPFFCIPTILWLNLSTIITNLIITMFGHFDIFSQMDLCHQNSNIYIELKY